MSSMNRSEAEAEANEAIDAMIDATNEKRCTVDERPEREMSDEARSEAEARRDSEARKYQTLHTVADGTDVGSLLETLLHVGSFRSVGCNEDTNGNPVLVPIPVDGNGRVAAGSFVRVPVMGDKQGFSPCNAFRVANVETPYRPEEGTLTATRRVRPPAPITRWTTEEWNRANALRFNVIQPRPANPDAWSVDFYVDEAGNRCGEIVNAADPIPAAFLRDCLDDSVTIRRDDAAGFLASNGTNPAAFESASVAADHAAAGLRSASLD